MNRTSQKLILSVLLGLLSCSQTFAQADYPNKPVRVLLGIAAGGGTDLIARIVMPKLSESLGQQFVIEYRLGAGGAIAAEAAASAKPDGYTLLFSPLGAFVTYPAIYKKLRYSPTRDFVPVSMPVIYPLVLVSSSSVPASSAKEFVAFLKKNTGKNNCGGAGAGFELVTRLFNELTGTDCTFIHYKGNNEATLSLYTGDLHFSFIGTGIQAAIKTGKVRGLAVTAKTRSPLYPDLPSATEAGIPDLQIVFWNGLFAPAGTPAPIVKRLEAQMQRIVKIPEVMKQLHDQQVEPAGMGSEELAKFIAAEIQRWDTVRKAANIPQIDY